MIFAREISALLTIFETMSWFSFKSVTERLWDFFLDTIKFSSNPNAIQEESTWKTTMPRYLSFNTSLDCKICKISFKVFLFKLFKVLQPYNESSRNIHTISKTLTVLEIPCFLWIHIEISFSAVVWSLEH